MNSENKRQRTLEFWRRPRSEVPSDIGQALTFPVSLWWVQSSIQMIKGLCSWRSGDSERVKGKGRWGKGLKVSLHGIPIIPRIVFVLLMWIKAAKTRGFRPWLMPLYILVYPQSSQVLDGMMSKKKEGRQVRGNRKNHSGGGDEMGPQKSSWILAPSFRSGLTDLYRSRMSFNQNHEK